MSIRQEQRADYAAINEVNDLAFGQPNEAKLIRQIRAADGFDPRLSFVATADEEVVGHILFSPIHIEGTDQHHPALALAPMAVRPQQQRKGIGSSLVREGLEICRCLGHNVVVVMGHVDFYPRFGFTPASSHGIAAPFDVPDAAFMVLALARDGFRGVSGIVRYPSAFDDV